MIATSHAEEHQHHAETVRDRAREDGLAAALRSIEEDLELLRDDRIEVDALDPENGAADVLDLDAAAVITLGLVDVDDPDGRCLSRGRGPQRCSPLRAT